ncbi:SNF2-related protein [Rhodocyclus purpureus]|uniref:SNF2-related protein n=1 Tax=Rhodocyclus purpureus TaxID=1067 RepID=UPI0019140527
MPRQAIPEDLSAVEQQTLGALALLWGGSTRTHLPELLRALGARNQEGQWLNSTEVKAATDALIRRGLVEEKPDRRGYFRVREPARSAAYLDLLRRLPGEQLRRTVFDALKFRPSGNTWGWPLAGIDASAAVMRVSLLSDTPGEMLAKIEGKFSSHYDQGRVLGEAFDSTLDEATLRRLPEKWRETLISGQLYGLRVYWQAKHLPLLDWLRQALLDPGWDLSPDIRYQTAEILLHRGYREGVLGLLAGVDSAHADALRAALLSQEGRWQEADTGFAAALKRLRQETGVRKVALRSGVGMYHALTLLAQQTPDSIEAARKQCLANSGARKPGPFVGWGLWVHAAEVRLGHAALEPGAFAMDSKDLREPDWTSLWRCLLRAWLGPAVAQPAGEKPRLNAVSESEVIVRLRERLQACGFAWLDAQVAAAEAVHAGGEAPPGFFACGGQESWRNVLVSLQALAEEAAGVEDASRIQWVITIDDAGYVEEIVPFEQKRGRRGWGKPKEMSLARLHGNEKLPPWDARVAQAVRVNPYHARNLHIDRAAAVMALIGHPSVFLAHAPDQRVDVVEGAPAMEVIRQDDGYQMRITPPLRRGFNAQHTTDPEQKREIEALNLITVVQDTPQRIRVIRFTEAQKRAASLLGERLHLPVSAEGELQKTLRALTGHFAIQSDHAAAAREVVAESRLRAELSPAGDGLILRLVVAPLGEDGPRLLPGSGHEQIMAAIAGEAVGTRRDIRSERAHLDAVLDALPFLSAPGQGAIVAEWLVEDPEQALCLVETLPQLAAVAGVDWPKGKSVRVLPVDSAQLAVSVRSEREWLRVSGEARLEEGLVLQLQQLLEWSSSGKGRFLPMGAGVYAALTDRLRARLADLAAVAEAGENDLRVPALASAWLDEAVQGTELKLDRAFRERVARLRTAEEQQPVLPRNLQAELRPYQEDGYAWATRLAAAGFGACLADDMGLGKTLQALALLLARAEGGAALVVAPTSVCGNWLAESARFAPSLAMQFYGEGDRSAMIEAAGPGDVILVSYTLLQQSAEAFASRNWHTLVVDEAQAIKNAAAKRSQAIFELAADFRLALSGTPVENRLAELWSIMRFCNPGLLGTLTRFNQRFAAPIERNRDRDAQHVLRRLIAPFVLRRTKAQVLQELPPRTELTLTVVPEADEAAHYEALRRIAVAEAESAVAADAPGRAAQARFNILAQLTRMRRAACDPRLTSPDLGIVGAKVQAFARLAVELSANGHKTLVFSQFVDFLALLRAPLDAAGIRYQYLDGSTPGAERSRRVAAFQQGEGDFFLISLKAGGFGLNLTAADYVVIADPWWNPAAEDQAMGRAHRIGQLRPVTVYRLVTQGSLEERIVKLHGEKRALAEGILAEGEGAALPSTDELIALIRG